MGAASAAMPIVWACKYENQAQSPLFSQKLRPFEMIIFPRPFQFQVAHVAFSHSTSSVSIAAKKLKFCSRFHLPIKGLSITTWNLRNC